MEVINLNIIPGKAQPIVHTSQYDVGRVIRCNLFEGAEVFYLDGTETIACNIKKPDNNIVTLSVTNTNDSYVEITTTEQATACDGSNLCEISITKGDDVIGSLNFIMEVERSPIEGGISSASEINNLWTQVDGMVADALATQYDSANVVFDNLPTEGHGIPYTVTSEGIGNAIDNALDMTAEASGAIATFESEYALPLRDLEIEINAVQESGTPTPSSPKAISGFTGANIHVADDENPHVIDNVTAITWQDEAGTVYGGYLRIVNGIVKAVVTDGFKTFTGGADEKWALHGVVANCFYISNVLDNPYLDNAKLDYAITNMFVQDTYFRITALTHGQFCLGVTGNTTQRLACKNTDIATVADWKTWLSSNNLTIKYKLATPVEYTLTSIPPIYSIVGTNNVFTDTNGDTSLEYYTKMGEQTVRIAEGVAVDVINNKSIDTLATTDKTVKGAINELEAGIDGIKAIETLFVTNTIATSTTEYSTYNSRKFSDYDFYLFKIGASALDVRRTVILSKADWISGASINEVMLHGSTASTPSSYTASTFTAGYHSDTSFDANVSGSGSLNYLTIHGIRKN